MSLEHLILLRHGETDWNAAMRMQGHRDIPLNAVGVEQAAAAAASVAALAPDVIVVSDLVRAQQTAAPVAEATGLAVQTDERLRETSMGQWEGLTRDEVIAGWPGMWERWRSSDAEIAPPDGESRMQVAQRAALVVDELDAQPYRRALLVSHGGLIVGLTGRLLGLPPECWSVLTGITNCHWVIVHRTEVAWRLHSYNAGLGAVVRADGEDEVGGT